MALALVMKPLATLARNARAKWLNFSRAVVQARREDGIAQAVTTATRWMSDATLRPVTRLRQSRVDHRLGVRTRRGPDGPAHSPLDPEVTAAATHRDSIAYGATPAHHFQRILRSLPVEVPADFTFVDLGCGKGLTLVLASDHGFHPVIGVELDPSILDVARDNVAAFLAEPSRRGRVIDLVHLDAARYEFPAAPTVAFLFNPFGEETLRAVVRNIERSLEQSPRPFLVAYYNPFHRVVLDRSHLLRRLSRTTRWAVYAASTTTLDVPQAFA